MHSRRVKKRGRQGSHPRVRRDPEAARGLILDAAERLFADRGPDAVALKDVAREAGVSHSLVSHYFGTFEKLVDAVLERRAAHLRAQMLEILVASEGDLRPGELLRRLFVALDDPAALRLTAWALLSGRAGDADERDFFPARVQGLRLMADAVEQRLRARSRLSREDIEFIVMASVALSYGYALMKKPLHVAMGREASAAAQEDFRARVADLIEQFVSRKR
jgi:AcrR family transcriptional regulator